MRQFWNIQGVRGVFRQSLDICQEKTIPNFLASGENIALDLHGNAYSMTGYYKRWSGAGGDVLTNLYYSAALDRIICMKRASGDLVLINPADGTANTIAAAFAANAVLRYIDWPLTGRVYISNGANYYHLTVVPTLTNLGATTGAGTVLYVHKNTVFSVKPPGRDEVEISPSSQDDPETFNTADILKFVDDGADITSLFELNGILMVGKSTTIYKVSGDAFSGSAKNPSKLNLNVGRGPLKQSAVLVEDNIAYFIGFDGFFRFNGERVEKLSTSIDAVLMEEWEANKDNLNVVGLYNPVWGQDSGKQYIIFGFVGQTGAGQYWLYDIHTGDFTQWADFDPAQGFVQSKKAARTYFNSTSEHIYVLENHGSNAGNAINSQLILNPIDGGARTNEKEFQSLQLYPMDYNGVDLHVGLNGVYPTVPINIAANQSAVELPVDQLTGHLLHLRFSTGQGGGTPLFSGISVGLDYKPEKKNRSFAVSRAEYLRWVMQNYPLIKVGRYALAGGEATVTISHGLNGKPEGVYVCQEGWTMANFLTVSNIDDDSFDVTFSGGSGHGAGDFISWIAVLPLGWINDSYLRGKPVLLSSNYLTHNLNQVPQALFLSKRGDNNRGVSFSDINSKSAKANLEAGHGNSAGTWIVARQGTLDTYFKVGTAVTSPINHGLGSTPDAVFIYPNFTPITAWGITSFSSTQILYSGSGEFYWMAVNLP